MGNVTAERGDRDALTPPRPVAAILSVPALRGAAVASVRHLVRPPAESRVSFHAPDVAGLRQLLAARPWIAFLDATPSGLSVASVRQVRQALPDSCLIGLLPGSIEGVRAAFELLRDGVDDVCVVDDRWIYAADLARIVDSAVARPTVRLVLESWEGGGRRDLRPFLERLWLRCGRPVSVREAAVLYHRDASTLQRHLRAAGLPSLNRLIVWGRLFHAARLLQRPERSVGEVARLLDFPSEQALRNQLKRYAAATATRVRCDGWQVVVKAFLGCASRG